MFDRFYFDVGWGNFWCLKFNCTARTTIVWKFDSYATMIKVRRLNAGFVRPNFDWLNYWRARHCRAVRPILLILSSFLMVLAFLLELGGSDGVLYYWIGFYDDSRTTFRYETLQFCYEMLRFLNLICGFFLWSFGSFNSSWCFRSTLIDWFDLGYFCLIIPKTSGNRHEIP